ncbi:hypothetical protein Q9L58_010247 [Maublancomyces gigas]|uniref:FAD-binding PCMH-type domain-containing protein n=1 Tax=Discina gigas TaxID=1032678 RepID=A0ABR3G4P4_9PEZI
MHSLSLLSFVLPLVSAFNSYRWPLNDCLNDHNVPLLLASSVGWAEEIEPYNLRFALTPNVVTIPRNVADVQAAVRCAYDAGIKVTVRSGGHSYGAYGLYGTMVLDLSEFQDVTLDSSNIASVGGGVRLGNMATKIFNLGQRALPHGTCPGVGVGGHGTLGGFGYSSRYWGLLVDTIVKFDVVHADGTFESVTATSNPDLFWALRGAGPGFAIVVTFYFETLPAPEENINWSYTYTFSSAYYAAISFEFATNWAYQNAPKELGFGIFVSANQFVVQGVYPGSIAALDDILDPLLAEMISLNEGKTPESSVQSYNWIDSLTVLGGGHLETPPEGDHSHDTFYVKSLDTHQCTPLSYAALESLFTYLYTTTPPSNSEWFIIANLYGGSDSVITSFPPSTDPASTSSYAGRDTGYVWQLYGYTEDSLPPFNVDIISFVKGMVDALGDEGDLPAYAPYADTELTQEEAQVRYWGGGVDRLKAIKAAVDPTGILYNPQGF